MAKRKPISKPREALRRTAGHRQPRSITLIVCEGETEQEYFSAVRKKYGLSTTEVIVADNTVGSAPSSVVKCAENKCAEPGSYDHIYCVFDRDGHESFERARKRIKELSERKRSPLPIKEAISIPCFEFWVLLHFERTDSPFMNCAAVIGRVKTHLPGYEKADADVCDFLMARLDEAISNAAWVEARAQANEFNPYTSVHRLIQHLFSVATS